MREPLISQYWDSESVPDYVEDLVATFRERNPDFRHRLCSEADAEELIAERFGGRELAAFRACAISSMQSDYFRYCSLLADGGIYADVDYLCLRPLRPLIDGSSGGEIFLGPTEFEIAAREANRVWSGLLAFREPGHPFLRMALDIATANLEARIAERVWAPGEGVVEAIWLTVGPGVPTLMRFIHNWGSFDAFRLATTDTPIEPFADLYCEVIGDHERLSAAFADVRVSTYERMSEWVADPEHRLPYKDTEAHWHNARTAIFR